MSEFYYSFSHPVSHFEIDLGEMFLFNFFLCLEILLHFITNFLIRARISPVHTFEISDIVDGRSFVVIIIFFLKYLIQHSPAQLKLVVLQCESTKLHPTFENFPKR